MIRNLIGKWAAPSKVSRVTIYHNPECKKSNQLLTKLTNYAALPCTANKYSSGSVGVVSKFNIEVKREPLSFDDYSFIVDECLEMHPDNKSVAAKLFKQGQVDKYSRISSEDFVKLCKDAMSKSTVIIDYSNKLIANDEATFDRIMANYLSCGIQQISNGSMRNGPKVPEIAPQEPVQPAQSNVQMASMQASVAAAAAASNFYKYTNLVHPNVAEFADLF